MAIMYSGGKTTKYEQGQYVFAIRQFTPFYAMRVLGELQKIISPALGGALEGLKTSNGDAQLNDMAVMTNGVSDALLKLAKTMNGEQLETAAMLLLDADYVSVAPRKTNDFQVLDESAINEVFSGRMIDMFALMVQVFKVNFLDFSKLSSVPTGVRKTLAEIKQSFQGNAAKNSSKKDSSTEH